MSRFVVRYRGKGPAPADVLRRAGEMQDLRVLDQTSRTLLVEGEERAVQEVFGDPDEWVVAPETSYAAPDPRPKVIRPPE